MSDLIDRQEALDALERSKKTYFDRQVIIGAMKDIVRNLPSAQPETHDERTETHACDLISRAAAIDAVHEEFDDCLVWDESGKRTADEFEIIINRLPSAQSEIIRCKDCKHFEYDHPYIIQGIPVLGHEVCNAWGDGCKTDENGYCFMAERRAYERTD